MEKKTYFCDKCGKEVKGTSELKTITIGNNGEWCNVYSYSRKFIVYKQFDLCIDCRNKIGLDRPEDNVTPKVELGQSTAERLYDIVAEIVQEQQQ